MSCVCLYCCCSCCLFFACFDFLLLLLYICIADIPSVAGAANQINTLLQKHNLNTLFLATDATSKGNF